MNPEKLLYVQSRYLSEGEEGGREEENRKREKKIGLGGGRKRKNRISEKIV